MLLRMYSRWAERRGFDVEFDEVTEGQEAGLLSATFIVKGRFAYGWISRGAGRAPPRADESLRLPSPAPDQFREPRGHAVAADDASEVEIDEKDLRVDTYRSSGAGGQHINKTDSAMRITHLPIGHRRQLPERAQPAPEPGARDADPRGEAGRARPRRAPGRDGRALGRRVRTTRGAPRSAVRPAPYQLVKDHRTDHETGNVDAVLDGDLDEFMEAELRRQRTRG